MRGVRKGLDAKAWTQSLGSEASRRDVVAEAADRRLDAALAMGNAKRLESDLDHAERSENHRGIDMPHMGDSERLAGQFADSDPEHHAAFFLAIAVKRGRIVAITHQHRGDGIGSLAGFRDVEAEHLSLRPDGYRRANGFGEQPVAQEDILKAFTVDHVDGL